jgi:hypothetical protein
LKNRVYETSQIFDASRFSFLQRDLKSVIYVWRVDCQPADVADFTDERLAMLRITRAANGEVVFKLSGRVDGENVAELETLISAEPDGRLMVLDLKDLTLVDQDAVSFLKRCEANNITLRNCPAYIREWITRGPKTREIQP